MFHLKASRTPLMRAYKKSHDIHLAKVHTGSCASFIFSLSFLQNVTWDRQVCKKMAELSTLSGTYAFDFMHDFSLKSDREEIVF